MIKEFLKNTGRFFILAFLQIYVFNNIHFSGFINPYIYVLFILLLPFETPRWTILITGFLLGFIIDIFTGTLGIHTSATVLFGFLRPYVLKIISPRDGYEAGITPTLQDLGVEWFLRYSSMLIIPHHFMLFFLETFNINDFFSTLLRAILSIIFSLIIILLSQYIFRKK